MVYIVTLLTSSIFAIGYDQDKNIQRKKVWLYIAVLLPLFVMAFRYGVGQDYFYTYVPVFDEILQNGSYSNIEFGFVLLNKFCQLFTTNSQSIFIVTSVLFCLFSFKAILDKKYDRHIFLQIYIFLAGGFYFYSFNVVRQCLVTAVFCYTIKFIQKREFFKFVFAILLAATIHKAALVYLPVYFLARRNFSALTYFVVLLFFIFASPLLLKLANVVLAGTKYENYLNGNYKDSSSSRISASQILNIIVFIVTIYLIKCKKIKDGKLIIYANIHFIGILFTALTGVIPLVFRLTNLFYLIQFLSVPYIINGYVPKKYRWLGYLVCILIYGALFVNSLLVNGNNILPYKFCF